MLACRRPCPDALDTSKGRRLHSDSQLFRYSLSYKLRSASRPILFPMSRRALTLGHKNVSVGQDEALLAPPRSRLLCGIQGHVFAA
jgi:hypothetical protein